MPIRTVRSTIVLLATILTTLTAALVGVSGPAAAGPQSTDSGQRCQILLAPAPAPGQPSAVLHESCAAPGQQIASPRAGTLLMTWHGSYSYGGSSTSVLGAGGPCDAAGYGFSYVGDRWNDNIRSYKVFNNCTYSSGWDHAEWQGGCTEARGNQPIARRGISSMWVSSGLWAWDLCG